MKLIFFIISIFCVNFSEYQTSNDIIGKYQIATRIMSEKDNKPVETTYYLSFKQKKFILSIKSQNVEDYWCEGEYSLKKEGYIYHGYGPCSDEDDKNDIFIKNEKNKLYIKSKIFINKDWMELKKK